MFAAADEYGPTEGFTSKSYLGWIERYHVIAAPQKAVHDFSGM
jgi:hypothetical protein